MAEVQQSGGDDGKKGKPKKQTLRVDFTPMVDMNMLLITFFMFCSTLSKPQIMDIAMPTNDKDLRPEDLNQAPESKTTTLLLGADNKVYYYFGKPNYDDYTSLNTTDYSPEGLRKVILDRNAKAVADMKALRIEEKERRMKPEEFKERASKIRNSKESEIIVIKPTPDSNYENLVTALDEMQICSVGKYAIVDLAEGDQFLIDNLNSKGTLGAQAPQAKK